MRALREKSTVSESTWKPTLLAIANNFTIAQTLDMATSILGVSVILCLYGSVRKRKKVTRKKFITPRFRLSSKSRMKRGVTAYTFYLHYL